MPKRVLAAQTLMLSLVVTLTACSSSPTTPILNFASSQTSAQAKTSMMSVKQVRLMDQRQNKALSVINGVNSPVDPNLTNKLQNWLTSSIQTNPNGRLNIDINLLSYASYVNQATMNFTAESMMEWQVLVTGKDGYSWKKTYQTTINQEGPLKMGNSDIETHLNKMASKLLNMTLNDSDFKTALTQQ